MAITKRSVLLNQQADAGDDTKLDWYGAMAEISYHNLTAMVAMTDIGGGKDNYWSDAAVGWEGGDDATEFMGYNSVLISDFL